MADAIIYELHLGTFTPEGTFRAAMEKLPHLQQLGITVIELMPIATFPGHRNWGYDGTYLFALQPDYGSYGDLKAFIEAAHSHGMAVLLDVVYNHFGPEGNYSGVYAPYTKQAATPGVPPSTSMAATAGIRISIWPIPATGCRRSASTVFAWMMPSRWCSTTRHATYCGGDHRLARSIGAAEDREILMIAEHLRNENHGDRRAGLPLQQPVE